MADAPRDSDSDQGSGAPARGGKRGKRKRELFDVARTKTKKIMEATPNLSGVAGKDAVYLMQAAVPLFVAKLVQGAFSMAQADGRKMLRYDDIWLAQRQAERFSFLRDVMPTPVFEAPNRKKAKGGSGSGSGSGGSGSGSGSGSGGGEAEAGAAAGSGAEEGAEGGEGAEDEPVGEAVDL